jgi:hypothetical protein
MRPIYGGDEEGSEDVDMKEASANLNMPLDSLRSNKQKQFYMSKLNNDEMSSELPASGEAYAQRQWILNANQNPA